MNGRSFTQGYQCLIEYISSYHFIFRAFAFYAILCDRAVESCYIFLEDIYLLT